MRTPSGESSQAFGDAGVRTLRPMAQAPGETGGRARETLRERYRIAPELIMNNLTRRLGVGETRAAATARLEGDYRRLSAEAYRPMWEAEVTPQQVAMYERDKAEIDRIWFAYKPNKWRHRQIAKLANAHDTLTLALNTGMRRTDLAQFAWIWLRDGAIIYTPQKGRNRARTSKKPARTVVLPILPDAARVLARRREVADGPRVLGDYTPHSLGALVLDVAKTLDLGRHLHDAKGTFVTRLKLETDLTPQEIAEIVDWSVASVQSIINRYVSGAAVSDALLKRFRRA